jgi:hypothetical protein
LDNRIVASHVTLPPPAPEAINNGSKQMVTGPWTYSRKPPFIEAMPDVLDAIRLLERKLWYIGRTGRKK